MAARSRYRADVTDRDAVFALVDRAADELGSVDVMVANAGIAQVKALLDVTPDDLRKIFEVNVFGVVYCMQAAAEKMIAQGTGGKIINAASIAAHAGSTCSATTRPPSSPSGRSPRPRRRSWPSTRSRSTPTAPASSAPTCGT